MKNIKRYVIKIINKLKNIYIYLIANTIYKKKIDRDNNCFNILNDIDLVDKIVQEKKSFSRFGDGELSLILDKNFNISFQNHSVELNKRLVEVLNSNINNLIIGISVSLNDPSIYCSKVQKYFRAFNYKYREKYKKIIPLDKTYGNSSITRFYIDYDKSDICKAEARLNNLLRIWNNRKVLIVEGKYTKLGVGNDLFNKTKSIRRIIVPEKNAFDSYNKILSCIMKNVKKDELVLLAVGPTATVLAYDLTKNNIQSVDVGHIDIEYEWMKKRARKRVAIKGKYVNEIKGKKYIESNNNEKKYEDSIICIINNN